MILYAVASEQSLGKLFLAASAPRCFSSSSSPSIAAWRYGHETPQGARRRSTAAASPRPCSTMSLSRSARSSRPCRRVLPFVLLLTGVMVALYGGYATSFETAGLGAIMALILVAVIYNVWRPAQLKPIMENTIREGGMLMRSSACRSSIPYVMSYLTSAKSAAEWVVAQHSHRWICWRPSC